MLKAFFEKLGVFETSTNEDGTYNVHGVDIFELGTAKGFDYTEEWAQRAIENFNERKAKNGFRPPAIVGHNSENPFFPSQEKPSKGFLDNIVLKAGKLYADFIRLPKDLFESLQKGEYPYRSLEVVPGEFSITACALLGGTEPFFKLTPLANFSRKNGRQNKSVWISHGVDDTGDATELFSIGQIREVHPELAKRLEKMGYDSYRLPISVLQKEEVPDMTKEEIEAREKELASQKVALDARSTSLEAKEKEVNAQAEKFAKMEQEAQQARTEAFQKDVKAYLTDMVGKGRLTPAMSGTVEVILMSHGATTVKFDSKDTSLFDMIKKFLSDIPETVNFSTVSKVPDPDHKEGDKEDMEKHEEFVAKIEQFKKDNPNASHKDALMAVMRKHPELASAYQKFQSDSAPKVAV